MILLPFIRERLFADDAFKSVDAYHNGLFYLSLVQLEKGTNQIKTWGLIGMVLPSLHCSPFSSIVAFPWFSK